MPGGRPKGSLNAATKDVKQLAGKYSARAFARLAEIVDDVDNLNAAVAAAKVLISYAHGLPTQSVEIGGSDSMPSIKVTFVDAK